MSASLIVVLLAASAAAPAPPEEGLKLPSGPPPVQVIASLTKEGDIEVAQTVVEYRTVPETREVVIDGRTVKQTVAVVVPVTVQSTRRLGAKAAKVYTANGKAVDPKDVAEKLKKPTIVLLSANGQKVDPFYLKIIKEDTLVLVAPVAAVPAP